MKIFRPKCQLCGDPDAPWFKEGRYLCGSCKLYSEE